MSNKIPEIRVYSPSGKGAMNSQTSTRFPWLTKSGKHGAVHHSKVINQPLRFFGSNPFPSTAKFKKFGSPVEMVDWKNTFNMRACNLHTLHSTGANYRTTYRSQAIAMQRAKLGFISGTAKSLDLLRQILQKSINKEIDEILQRYLERFFKLAIENIKSNKGENAVSEQHVQTVCRQILEEAKKMYQTNSARGSSPSTEFLEVEASNLTENKRSRPVAKAGGRKRKDSDTDSEISGLSPAKPKKKKGRPALYPQGAPSGRSTPMKLKSEPIKRAGPKWDPARITPQTQFIMGAKANKALGLGATRGRLYIKHPDIFKYSGDQDDKQWLYDHNLMPATGGKAYMLLVEDIQELVESEEYKYNPSLLPSEIVGFTVSETMLEKMRVVMQQMRTDVPVRKRGRPPVSNADTKVEEPVSDGKCGDSGTATPTDELDLLGADITSAGPSPFSLGTGFDDVSPVRADISPALSDVSTNLEPPLTAPFDITETP